MQPLQQLYTCNHGLMYRVIFLTKIDSKNGSFPQVFWVKITIHPSIHRKPLACFQRCSKLSHFEAVAHERPLEDFGVRTCATSMCEPIMFSSFFSTCSMCENEFYCCKLLKSGQLTSYRLIVTSHYLPWDFIYILSVVIAGFLNHQQYGCKMVQENGKRQLSSSFQP